MSSAALEVVPPQQLPNHPVYSFAPTSFRDAMEFAKILSDSDIVPKQYKAKPADVFVAMQYGAEVGLQPLQSLNSICVINGRPGFFGDGFIGIILAQPDCLDVEEEDLPVILAKGSATCTIRRRNRKPVTRTFTLEMAKSAGLLAKDGPWKTYPARQLQMRARGFAGRDAYADVLRGIKIADELNDYDGGQTIDGGAVKSVSDVPDNPITQDQAREFSKAWKASGKTLEQAKVYLKESLAVDSSLKIRASQLAAAMAWATSEAKPEARDKELCFELFKILGYDDIKQAQAIKEHGADWTKLAIALNAELPAE